MSMTWIVVASTVEAKIYALGQTKGELTLLQEFSHPEGRYKTGDVGFDKPGQFEVQMHGQSESFERADPKFVENMHFAKKIAAELEKGRNQHQFEHFMLVAEPRFYGMLREACNDHLLKMNRKNIQKDYIHMPAKELYAHVIELPE